MESSTRSGVVTVAGKQSQAQTVPKIEELLRTRGLKLRGAIDLGGAAEEDSLHLCVSEYQATE
ncbi:MAG: hypothetical protein J0H49_00045, partial [Acidobacteria bacterium]|nr:hypothetical protein [Acidobacteriota bacterium]